MFLRLVFSVLLVLVALPTAYACRYGYGGYSGYSRYGSYGGYGGDTAVTEGTKTTWRPFNQWVVDKEFDSQAADGRVQMVVGSKRQEINSLHKG
ncbi:hypothetical protein QR680_003613 [Steinernema hermaphroditum]|uniref:Uncharacterized protein n=1 Tax=Steinernema hermaphroditum TaxID=289476 RepID=A0AA39HLZ3_9BILA|nr:hypothetical protein QR680_003613 [Steinernema hermaphroditum]